VTSFLSRIRLRSDVPAAAIAASLLPDDRNQRHLATHRLLWTLFSDGPDRQRDFLWREAEGDGAPLNQHFLALSTREPTDHHDLFKVETKPFAPNLSVGDRLGFSLRVNPVISRPSGENGRRGKRHDVVMDSIKPLPKGERSAARQRFTIEAGRDWLTRRAERHGFLLLDEGFSADGYQQLRIPRHGKPAPITFSVLDLGGVIEVLDPERFLMALHQGFGPAKAFGCGLMLIRRV